MMLARAPRSRPPWAHTGVGCFGLLLVAACHHAPKNSVELPSATIAVRSFPVRHEAQPSAGAPTIGELPTIGESSSTESNVPVVVFHGQATTTLDFALEARGFPAISRDRELVALAFHELNTTGPPVLELGVQLRSVASERVVYAAKFREPYPGEVGQDALERIRQRARAWVEGVNQRLSLADLAPIVPIVRDETAVCNDEAPALHIPSPLLDVQYRAGRLVVRDGIARVALEHPYPTWTVVSGKGSHRCKYLPYVTEAAFDAQSKVLVVKADHCSPSDSCIEGVVPDFAVVVLENP